MEQKYNDVWIAQRADGAAYKVKDSTGAFEYT